MEKDMKNTKVNEKIENTEKLENITGGKSGSSDSGYCPYTTDRKCHTAQSGWDAESENCKYCGWRAW